ncbi:MAG: gliding motility-associated C-terminal domain-containing protein [Bacteroidia bacterium]
MKQLIGLFLWFLLCSPFLTISTPVATTKVEQPLCISYIPSAISPNGDGVNDYFQLQYKCEPEQFSMRIYDSASKLILEVDQADHSWDGSYDGEIAPEGAYVWIISYQTPNGRQISQRGKVMLIL